jgi:hypothetical protein
VISPSLKEDTKEDISGQHFSLIVGETTDVSVHKVLAIIVRFFSRKSGKVTDALLELVSLSTATGESLFLAIRKALESFGLDLNKCVGFGCDGASVMIGHYNLVWSCIHEINPDCVLMKCICHSLTLCIQQCFDKLPSNLGYLMQEIPGWFSHSIVRRDDFKALLESIDDNDKSEMPFVKYSSSRWLSRGKVISNIHRTGHCWMSISPR